MHRPIRPRRYCPPDGSGFCEAQPAGATAKTNCLPANCDLSKCDPTNCDWSKCLPPGCDPKNCDLSKCMPGKSASAGKAAKAVRL
ncbi:MAG: hypothetical protein IPM98_03205 [Lewinellaceae bacterium]|nr:hypothetical protein [Lewinellaceae bacterium]